MCRSKAYKLGLLFCLLLVAVFGIKLWYTKDFSAGHQPTFGVTFSNVYAEQLGLNWREAYLALLDDLKIKHFRLVAYWSEVEPAAGQYNFSDLDWQVEQAAKRGVSVILVVGQRVPRWPECHFPEWVNQLSAREREEAVLKILQATVNHFKNQPAIFAWQVENEPLLTLFGNCPKSHLKFLKQEAQTVRELDSRPIIISDSGELSGWLRVPQAADILGITMYRVVWHKNFGYLNYQYFYPASYYHYKAKFIQWLFGLKDIIVTEYQAEPWGIKNKSLADIDLAEQLKTMDAKNFEKYLKFARQTGFSQIYLWGAEWWYWLKLQGDNSVWQAAKKIWQ